MAERREERANKGGKFSNRKSSNNPLKFYPTLSFQPMDPKDGLLNFYQFASFGYKKNSGEIHGIHATSAFYQPTLNS